MIKKVIMIAVLLVISTYITGCANPHPVGSPAHQQYNQQMEQMAHDLGYILGRSL